MVEAIKDACDVKNADLAAPSGKALSRALTLCNVIQQKGNTMQPGLALLITTGRFCVRQYCSVSRLIYKILTQGM